MPLGPIEATWAFSVLVLVPVIVLILPPLLGSSPALAANRTRVVVVPAGWPRAIVLAAFGTTRIEAISALENIEARVRAAFPESVVRMAFTSGHVRRVWSGRAEDSSDPIALRWAAVKDVSSTLSDLFKVGHCHAFVQSLHVIDGEEYRNMARPLEVLSRVPPRSPIRLGTPALGLGDGEQVRLNRAALALRPWLLEAESAGAALVLMGHGNERLKPKAYRNLEARLRQEYPRVFVGTVEGGPGAEEIADLLASDRPPSGRVILAPLLVVAGEHAREDMAGEGPGSWRGIIAAKNLAVETRLTGLGSVDSWADIYVESLSDLAALKPY